MPTLTQIRNWDTAHLTDAAQSWTARAEDWERSFTNVENAARAPGGLPWLGAAADAAQARTFADRMRVLALADVLHATATVATTGAADLASARQRVLSAVTAAVAEGFEVDEDLSVHAAVHAGQDADAVLARGRYWAGQIGARAAELMETDRGVATSLTRSAGDLSGSGPFDRDGDGVPEPPADATAGDPSQIPPPPPWQPHDKGAGEWGSQPWYSRGDDLAFKAAIEEALPAIGLKWPHAAQMMQRYLDNTGGRQQVDLDGMLSGMPEMQSFADQILIQPEIDRIVAQAQSNNQYNQPIPFRTGWKGYYLPPEKYPDWFRAVGGVDLSAGGVVTVSPPATPGGPPQVNVTSQLNLADQYNWDPGKTTQVGPVTISDARMAGLQTAGLAREFTISGSSQVRSYTR